MEIHDPRLQKALKVLLRQRKISHPWTINVDAAQLRTLALLQGDVVTEPMLVTVREMRLILRNRQLAIYHRQHGRPFGRRKIFADKVRTLIEKKRLTQKEAAEKWQIPYKLLRRWATVGVAQSSVRTEAALRRLCDELGLATVAELWQP